MTGTLLPDLVDKSIQWLGVTPHGRSIGHSAIVWLSVVLLSAPLRTRSIRGASAVTMVLTGVALHLLGDLADDLVEALQWSGVAFSGWAGWPVTDPDVLHVRVPAWGSVLSFRPTILELAVVALLGARLLSTRPSPPWSSATRGDRGARPFRVGTEEHRDT